MPTPAGHTVSHPAHPFLSPRGEYHANNQTMAKLLHKSIGLGAGSMRDPESYDAYMRHFKEVGFKSFLESHTVNIEI